MYAIKWTRVTGESGVLKGRYESKRKAHPKILELIHRRDAPEYEYKVIEV